MSDNYEKEYKKLIKLTKTINILRRLKDKLLIKLQLMRDSDNSVRDDSVRGKK